MEDNGALSPSMLVPLRMLSSAHHGCDSSLHRQLAIVPPFTTTTTTTAITTSQFHLPEGWEVEKVRRPNGGQIDKYYYEPETGQKFRSLKAVERYLTGEEYTQPRKRLKLRNHVRRSGSRKMIVSRGMLLRLEEDESNQRQLAVVAPTIAAATSPFVLPDGWIVEEVPRKCGGYTDKYYYEPGTGRQFRSLISVERYLAEVEDNAPLSQVFELCQDNAPLSQVLKLCSRVKNFGSRKKISRDKVKISTSDSDKPPAKINWVLADHGGCTWNPFTGESMVPEPVKQQWANRFTLSINDGNCAAPDFEW
uniref:Methyl-CpG-binding domain protein n=1 Tax=Camellia sinensis TaxID=4442 RepID=A0A8X8M3Z9_CAMSI|nr:methyl-CpG-binding domain protein [Camellia sinensis]